MKRTSTRFFEQSLKVSILITSESGRPAWSKSCKFNSPLDKIGTVPKIPNFTGSEVGSPFADQSSQIDQLLTQNTKFFSYAMLSQMVAAIIEVFNSEYGIVVEASRVHMANQEKIVHKCLLAIPVSKTNCMSYLSLWLSEGFLKNLNESQGGDLNRFAGVETIVNTVASLLSYELSIRNIFEEMPPISVTEFGAPPPICSVTFAYNNSLCVVYLH